MARSKKVEQKQIFSKGVKTMIVLFTALVIIFSLVLLVFTYKPSFTGLAGYSADGQEWENHITIAANSSQEKIIQHIVFGRYKPASCKEGIYIEANGQAILFETTNEIYDSDNLCTETDVIFDNVIYKQIEPTFEIQTETQQQQSITYEIYYGKITKTEPAVEEQPSFELQADISTCSDLSAAGTYYLTADISNSNQDTCMKINASNVVLDCQNHTIDGDDTGSYGINVVHEGGGAVVNVTVKNCVVTDWGTGVGFGVKTATLQNCNLSSNTYGLVLGNDLIGLSTYSISSNRIWNNDLGLYADSSSGIVNGTISDNHIYSNLNGTYARYTNLDFINNNISSNSNYNAVFLEITNCTISSNIFNSVPYGLKTGLKIIQSNNVTVYNNTASSNGEAGIVLENVNNSLISHNFVSSNFYDGIYLNSSSNNNLTDNIINNNGNGLETDGFSVNLTIINNTLINNDDRGIGAYQANNSIVINNNISGAGYAIDFGYNGNTNITIANNTLLSANWGICVDDGIYINVTNNFIHLKKNGWGSAIVLDSLVYSNIENNYVNYSDWEGMELWDVNYTNITNNTIAKSIGNGIELGDGWYNTFTGNVINSSDSKGIYFYSSSNNILTNNTATNNSESSWLYLNVSYNEDELGELDENKLNIAKHNNSGWFTDPNEFTDGTYGVNTEANYVYANITNFGSIFTPLGFVGSVNVANCINITTPGYYALTQDILNSHAECCINITSSDVIFDGQGHIVDGVGINSGYRGICADKTATTLT
ncbi:MAG: right-handed parallel beta-helix repeat-containing protein, partial [Candidatus Nanoarchaeia archaeon]